MTNNNFKQNVCDDAARNILRVVVIYCGIHLPETKIGVRWIMRLYCIFSFPRSGVNAYPGCCGRYGALERPAMHSHAGAWERENRCAKFLRSIPYFQAFSIY